MLPIHLYSSPFSSFIFPLPWKAKRERKQEQESGLGSDQTPCVFSLCVCVYVCEEQLKSNSSEQVCSSNDLSLLSISPLTTSCRGRHRQGQTQPRQKDRHINRQEEREQGRERGLVSGLLFGNALEFFWTITWVYTTLCSDLYCWCCLSVFRIAPIKKNQTDFAVIYMKGVSWKNLQLVRFWWLSVKGHCHSKVKMHVFFFPIRRNLHREVKRVIL